MSINAAVSCIRRFTTTALLFGIASTGCFAADPLSADDIASAVSDRTYQGSMIESAFAEYYAADGSIRGKDYTGKWRTEDDTMCFQYGDSDEKCWNVIINGPAMTLIKDGQVDGSGMLVDGNPGNL